MIQTTCPECSKPIEVPESQAGKVEICIHCGKEMVIPKGATRMTRRQRIIIAIAGAVIVLMCLIPPVTLGGHQAGYRFIFALDTETRHSSGLRSYRQRNIHVAQLLVQVLAVVAAAGTVIALPKGWYSRHKA